MAPLVWLITGTSSGFGSELATQALARGDKVIATSRNVSKLQKLKDLGADTYSLDVTSSDAAVNEVVAAAIEPYGRIDILINNAGYPLGGACEAVSQEEIQAQFDCNVFGALRMARAVLPYMRARRSGVVANLGSISGWSGGASYGPYCASKFALAGMTEALKEEVAPLGIDVACIEPGYFRTNFLEAGNRRVAAKKIEDYASLDAEVQGFHDSVSRKQAGDPVKGCRVMVQAVTKTGPFAGATLPARMSLGSDAAVFVRDKLAALTEQHERWMRVTRDTDCDDVEK